MKAEVNKMESLEQNKAKEIKIDSIENFVYNLTKADLTEKEPLFFMKDPNGDWTLAISSIKTIHAHGKNRIEKIKKQLRKEKDTIAPWVGGVSFSKEKNNGIWKDFPNTFFYQPKHFLRCKSNKINLFSYEENDFYALEKEVKKELKSKPETPNPPTLLEDKKEKEKKWSTVFNKSISLIKKNVVSKIVIFSERELDFKEKVLPHELWFNFIKSNPNENSYRFFLYWKGSIFLGFTPETLFTQKENLIKTEAIAGTITRGNTKQADLEKEKTLYECKKNKKEHQYVVDFFKKQLRKLYSQPILVGERKILKLNHVQHLHTELSVRIRKKIHSLDILKMLHPSPAMCGYPRRQAEKALARLKNQHRGFYASPIGFFDTSKGEAKFLVAIRSAILQQKKLYAFAGVGLVSNSEKKEEWEEIEQKFKTILSIFDRKKARHGKE